MSVTISKVSGGATNRTSSGNMTINFGTAGQAGDLVIVSAGNGPENGSVGIVTSGFSSLGGNNVRHKGWYQILEDSLSSVVTSVSSSSNLACSVASIWRADGGVWSHIGSSQNTSTVSPSYDASLYDNTLYWNCRHADNTFGQTIGGGGTNDQSTFAFDGDNFSMYSGYRVDSNDATATISFTGGNTDRHIGALFAAEPAPAGGGGGSYGSGLSYLSLANEVISALTRIFK